MHARITRQIYSSSPAVPPKWKRVRDLSLFQYFLPPRFPQRKTFIFNSDLFQLSDGWKESRQISVAFEIQSNSRIASIRKFEIRVTIKHRCRISIFTILSHKIAATIRSESHSKEWEKGTRERGAFAQIYFYRSDEKSFRFIGRTRMEKYLSRRSRPLRKFPLARVDRYGSPIPREDKEWVRDLYRSIFSLHFAARGDRKRTRAGKTRPARQLSRAPISLSFSLVFIRFLVFRAFSNEAWIRSTRWDPYGARHVRDWT